MSDQLIPSGGSDYVEEGNDSGEDLSNQAENQDD
jgi:hypothetical protein